MSDQATQLRQLVLRAARQREADGLPPPRIAAVLAARPGCGVTAVAAGLGRALVEQGSRVVAIDADAQHRDLAGSCGVDVPATYDAAAARHDIHESLLRAPGGLQVVPGVWDDEGVAAKAAQQLLRQFQQLGRHADWLVLDLGACSSDLLSQWSEAIQRFVIVATPDASVVMETYAMIKRSLEGRAGEGLELFVNQAADDAIAGDVLARVDRSCRRFLGLPIQFAGRAALGDDLSARLAGLAGRLCDRSVEQAAQRRAA